MLAELPRESVARILRQTRASYGQSLESVAESLRIRLVHLKAIEDGRYEDLPGAAYAVGFVGTYADYLRLDREEIVRQFKEEIQGQDQAIQLVFPAPAPEGKVPGGAIILISVLLVAVIYGVWFYLSNQNTQLADLIPDVPERLQALLSSDEADEPGESAEPSEAAQPPAAEAPAVSESPESVTESVIESVLEPAPVPESVMEAAVEPVPATEMAPDMPVEAATTSPEIADGSPTPPEASTTQDQGAEPMAAEPPVAVETVVTPESSDPSPDDGTALAAVTVAPPAAPPAAPPVASSAIPAAPSGGTTVAAIDGRTPRVYGSDNAQSRITLHATLDSWVQVRDGEGDLLLTRVLRPGDSYRVPDQTGLTLVTGNAGGLRIEVDGTALAPIGRVGMVRRNIALDPQRLVDGTASP